MTPNLLQAQVPKGLREMHDTALCAAAFITSGCPPLC